MSHQDDSFRPFGQEWYQQAQNELLYYFSQLDASYSRPKETTILSGDRLPNINHDTLSAKEISSERAIQQLPDETREKLYYLQSQATKGELASLIAHEINNHLMAITGNLFFALQSIDSNDELTAKQKIERCLEKIEEMKSLTEALQTGNRVETRKSLVNINEVIRELLEWALPVLQKKGAQFVLHLKQEIPTLKIDAAQLQQAIFNLLNNAVQAKSDCTVHIYTQLSNQDLVIRILDDGPGISSENLKELFKPFFTLRKGGHGLGLNIVKDIITSHGGKITVQSEVGKGTAFKIVLPIMV